MIDRTAPVVVETQIEISASPCAVWAVLIDASSWPKWNGRIDTAELRGPPVVGSVIHWTTSGMTIESRLTTVKPERALDWDGSDGATRGLHSWRLQAFGARTIVTNSESMTGGFASENPAEMTRMLQAFLEAWNQLLKARVESVTGEPED